MKKSLFTKEQIGFILGPLSFVMVLAFFAPEGLSFEGRAVLASALWMAIWWTTEAIPLAVTGLLPVLLFPLSGGLPLRDTLSGYSHPFIFLFIGGFILAIAIEKWNLHKRIALLILSAVGSRKKQIILGFMLGTAFLSMWISNTATAAMMLPIGVALIHQLRSESGFGADSGFGKALMLAIAYSASIGGMATLIGTPPNLILAGVIQETFAVEISFFGWMAIGVPAASILIVLVWQYLTRVAFRFDRLEIPGGKLLFKNQLKALGKMQVAEKRVRAIFILTALAWMSRTYLITPFIPAVDDTIIAITAGITLFMLPAGEKGSRLLIWEDTVKLPWGILILFGGGIALAVGFDVSGLSQWIGAQLQGLEGLPVFLLILSIVAVVNLLTEITSNLATTAMLLPILASLALVADVHPLVLMAGATLAASCAFMLPVATPPNAIVFGSGHLRIADMVRAGAGLNFISIVLITLLAYFLMPLVWDVDLFGFPDMWKK